MYCWCLQMVKMRETVEDPEFWQNCKMTIKVMRPALRVLRHADGKASSNLALLYDLMLELDKLYAKPIEGLPERIREKVICKFQTLSQMYHFTITLAVRLLPQLEHITSLTGVRSLMQIQKHWLSRWRYLEADVHAAAYALSPQFCRNEFDDTVAKSLGKVMADFAQAPGCKFSLDDLTEQYDAFVTALNCESNRFDNKRIKRPGTKELLVDGAFTERSLAKTPTQWIQTFMAPWPALKWMSLKIVNMPASASYCEHAWSIEGWMHSKRRNRLKQSLVEKLVRGHGNYIFMEHEEAKKENRIIWDVELEVEEPISEEERDSSDEDDEMDAE